MAEYIERETAINCLMQILDKPHHAEFLYTDEICGTLNSIPAADVRPVVLCRECVHWERYDNTAGCGYCHKVKFEYGANGYVFYPIRASDFYCADGEKRNES